VSIPISVPIYLSDPNASPSPSPMAYRRHRLSAPGRGGLDNKHCSGGLGVDELGGAAWQEFLIGTSAPLIGTRASLIGTVSSLVVDRSALTGAGAPLIGAGAPLMLDRASALERVRADWGGALLITDCLRIVHRYSRTLFITTQEMVCYLVTPLQSSNSVYSRCPHTFHFD
jgi:hypothetical protein